MVHYFKNEWWWDVDIKNTLDIYTKTIISPGSKSTLGSTTKKFGDDKKLGHAWINSTLIMAGIQLLVKGHPRNCGVFLHRPSKTAYFRFRSGINGLHLSVRLSVTINYGTKISTFLNVPWGNGRCYIHTYMVQKQDQEKNQKLLA